jgi:hypothetical protein
MTVKVITGTTERGQRDARENYPNMISAAASYCAAVADCGRYGTINVRLDDGLDKSRADCWTARLLWRPLVEKGKPYCGDDRSEEFGFIKIKFEYPLLGQLYDAWIILPSGHYASHYDANLVEIITAELIGGRPVPYEAHCAIHLDHTPSLVRPASFGDNYWVERDEPQRLW